MDKAIKEKWLEALRSGAFKQGKASLHKEIDGEHTYCCLGVLCEVLEIASEQGMNGRYYYYTVGNDGESYGYYSEAGLPLQVQKEQGLESLGWIDGLGVPAGLCLSTLNDRGSSFAEIADVIEKYIPGE